MTIGCPLAPFFGFFFEGGAEKEAMTCSRRSCVILPSNLQQRNSLSQSVKCEGEDKINRTYRQETIPAAVKAASMQFRCVVH